MILCAIPTIGSAEMTKLAIDSVIDEAEVLVIDNNSDAETKLMLMREDIMLIENEENLYVNPSWNEILDFFLKTPFDTLIIMNSDMIMQASWSQHLDPTEICIPTDGSHTVDTVVTEGTPGVFIHLSREMVRIVYPIPEEILVWYGDNWIYTILRSLGYQTVVKSELIGRHYNGGSQSVNVVPNIHQIIEQDKIMWRDIVEPLMLKIIEQLKNEKGR